MDVFINLAKRALKKLFIQKKLDLFDDCTIKYDENGFWVVDPMPSESSLAAFYENNYWPNRGGKFYGISIRDLIHDSYINSFLTKIEPGNFLNFGAGHGGISHLFHKSGHNIINIEPSGLPCYYHNRWKTVGSWDNVEDQSIDFFYASHSIEHVTNIDNFMLNLRRKVKDTAYLFIEVPNGLGVGNGPVEGRVYPPHTYYLTKSWFLKNFSKIIVLDSYNESHVVGDIDGWPSHLEGSNKGRVIRAICQI